jgi:hypothetical protein
MNSQHAYPGSSRQPRGLLANYAKFFGEIVEPTSIGQVKSSTQEKPGTYSEQIVWVPFICTNDPETLLPKTIAGIAASN